MISALITLFLPHPNSPTVVPAAQPTGHTSTPRTSWRLPASRTSSSRPSCITTGRTPSPPPPSSSSRGCSVGSMSLRRGTRWRGRGGASRWVSPASTCSGRSTLATRPTRCCGGPTWRRWPRAATEAVVSGPVAAAAADSSATGPLMFRRRAWQTVTASLPRSLGSGCTTRRCGRPGCSTAAAAAEAGADAVAPLAGAAAAAAAAMQGDQAVGAIYPGQGSSWCMVSGAVCLPGATSWRHWRCSASAGCWPLTGLPSVSYKGFGLAWPGFRAAVARAS